LGKPESKVKVTAFPTTLASQSTQSLTPAHWEAFVNNVKLTPEREKLRPDASVVMLLAGAKLALSKFSKFSVAPAVAARKAASLSKNIGALCAAGASPIASATVQNFTALFIGNSFAVGLSDFFTNRSPKWAIGKMKQRACQRNQLADL
jgi:hypothetical protein